MLTDNQIKAIELLALGELKGEEVAKECNISSRQLYRWKNDDEFRAEWQKRSQQIQTALAQEGKARMIAKGQIALDNVLSLANKADSEKVKLDANIFILEHIFGKATTKVADVTNKEDKDNINTEDLTQEFNKFKILKKAK